MGMQIVSLINYKTRDEANKAAARHRGHGTTAVVRKNGPHNYPYSVTVKPTFAPPKRRK